MRSGSRQSTEALPIAPVVLWAVAGAAWTWWWVRYGPGMTADTMDYIGIGRAPFQLHPDAFQWPPAFWLCLQVARAVGLPVWAAATVVLCGARALLASGAYRLGRRLAGAVGGHALAAVTFVWAPLTYAGLYCLSETLFLGAMVWWLSATYAIRSDAPDLVRRAWIATLWATLMTSTRFVGLPMAIVELCVAAICLRNANTKQWARSVGLMLLCIVGPAIAWALLGQALHGSGLGERFPSRHSIATHVQFTGTAWWDPIVSGRYGDIFWGDQGVAAPPAWAQAVLYLAACAMLWLAVQPRKNGAPLWRPRMAACALAYLVVLIGSSIRIWLDPIGPRFMLPVVMLALAGAWFPLTRIVETRWLLHGLLVFVVAWIVDRALGGGLQPRFGTWLFAIVGFGGAAFCRGAAWLDPRPATRFRQGVAPAALVCLALFLAQGAWSLRLLQRVEHAALPSVQHPGWRNEPAVRALRELVQPDDTIYSQTEDTVRAILDDRRDITVDRFCFNKLYPDCELSLTEYLHALDVRRREHAEWIVLLDRVAVPYLFLDELDSEVEVRGYVGVVRSESVYAYRWGPNVVRVPSSANGAGGP